jgi:hypothetical protein
VTGYSAPRNAHTQREEILALLTKARGEWVPLPQIMACAAQYNARVFELRRLGFEVENRSETVDGVRRSWFRLRNLPEQPAGAGQQLSRFEQAHQRDLEIEVPLLSRGVA